jgi:predicted short-subunit dehydrogenase-like oxidoreductase (DUF2520 family)
VNRQVPEQKGHEPIAIVGNGRVARHMIRYFELSGQPYLHWFRNASMPSVNHSRLARFKYRLNHLFQNTNTKTLNAAVVSAKTVLLLIPDDQIEPFIDDNPSLEGKTLIHFSGALNSDRAMGCHPLMTFGPDLYDLQRYQSIPFVVEESVDFRQIFPSFKNPVHHIKSEQKVMYHAMCVMAGNFSQLLWQATSAEMVRLGLPADLMHAYLQQNTQNYINDPQNALTGPLVRGDVKTIEQHRHALKNQPLQGIYQSFCDLYHQPVDKDQRSQL